MCKISVSQTVTQTFWGQGFYYKTAVFAARGFWQIQHIAPNSATVAHSVGYEQSGLDREKSISSQSATCGVCALEKEKGKRMREGGAKCGKL